MSDTDVENTDETKDTTATEVREPENAADDAAGDSGARRPRLLSRLRGPRATLAVRAATAAALVLAVAAAAFWFVQNKNNEDLLEAQDQARTAACRYAPVLANYDAKDLDAYFAAVLDGATGDWKKQFDSTSRELREVLTQGEVVSKTNDVQCAIRTADESSAEAIVVIGQSITSLGTQGKPAPGQLSMVLRLEKSGDRWLVNKVNSPLAPPRLP
jgi:Mce-associated membrane protein